MPSQVELINGAFQDSEGNVLANGYLIFRLSQDCSVSGVGNICSGITIKITLDADGNAVAGQYIWGNDVLMPQPNFYTVEGFAANGQPAWGPNNQQVEGSGTFDLGTWVPNTIISWTPTVFQPLTLEVNGVAASSQSTQNLYSSDSSVTITDEGSGDINFQVQAGGGSLNGNGAFMIGPGLMDLSTIYINNCIGSGQFNTTAGVVQLYLFEIAIEFTVNQVSIVSLGNNFSCHATFGIYDITGNKLVDGGSFVELTGSGVQTNVLGSPVTLPPGTYWFAQSTDTSNTGDWPAIVVAQTSMPGMLAKNYNRAATASNAATGGVLPATLGTLSAFTPSDSNGDCIFCPLFE